MRRTRIILAACGFVLTSLVAAAAPRDAAAPPAAREARAPARDAGPDAADGPPNPITREMVAAAEKLIGLPLTDAKRNLLRDGVNEHRLAYEKLRQVPLSNDVPPALGFNPIPPGSRVPSGKSSFRASARGGPPIVPNDPEGLAFHTVGQLAQLIKARKISSLALTEMYLGRLRRHDPKLHAVITLTEDRAREQARRADREIAAGRYRGPLHGIPYGLKDLFATKGLRTTWGSVPFKDQVIDEDATVVKRLEAAGAVLVAKTTVGELAWGDVWFGGKTKNPWNLERGSSGSSAGSAAATAAGLVPFAIGTETWGSIVSPATECGVSGLRPGYGRVSRSGGMALSWSMDKVGVLCRAVEDCAMVFAAIQGPDGADQSVYDAPFVYPSRTPLRKLRIGYVKVDFERERPGLAQDRATLETLRGLGIELAPIELPRRPIAELAFILASEAAAAFDELTRSGKDDLMVRQIRNAWPNVLREARFIPAVEYLQANRVRQLLVRDMAALFSTVDVYVAPSRAGDSLLLTNLTGHPAVVVPNGFTDAGLPTSITFTGRLFGEAEALLVAKAYQDATGFHTRRPKLD